MEKGIEKKKKKIFYMEKGIENNDPKLKNKKKVQKLYYKP